MGLDPSLGELSGTIFGMNYDNLHSEHNNLSNFRLNESQNLALPQVIVASDSNPLSTYCFQANENENDNPEDCEVISDEPLNYISRMLMEEDIDGKVSMYQEESAALRAAAKPFYDILGQKFPPSPDRSTDHAFECPHESSNSNNGHSYSCNMSSTSSNGVADCSWPCDVGEYRKSHYSSQSSFSPAASVGNVEEQFEEPLITTGQIPEFLIESLPAWHFRRGVEEAQKFLPESDKLVIDLEASGTQESEETSRDPRSNGRKREEEKEVPKGRKNPQSEDLDSMEGRNAKQSAVFYDEPIWIEMFDDLLRQTEKKATDLREMMRNEATKNAQVVQAKASGGPKSRGRKQSKKKELVDLRMLLIHCSQAVSADDRRTANELLKQIRQHSSLNGDGSQRLSHYFADGLEARLAGTGSQIYQRLVAKRTTVSDMLKAYHLYLAACPFKRLSHFLSNQTILNLTEKAKRVHIIDFGIYFGFQWPCLIKRLAHREGGPPMLRITGIDVPQPGFRPTERIEETGQRLADYAKKFGVPFEYQGIASKWEKIRVEDLNIDKAEVVIVNCLYRFRNLIDETVAVDSPRNTVLDTIRQINPAAFIHGIVNGSYSVPFFVTRFREALFHFSSLFDMLETTVPRGDPQRLLIERDLFGREALNVIACEGSERVERPETYKQWQVRNLRAGFVQLPLNQDIMKRAKEKVKAIYHKDFVVDEDIGWLLQGWKGRIIYAVSTWKPTVFFSAKF